MEKYLLITWPNTQELEGTEGFEDHSYLCAEIAMAYFVEEKWYLENIKKYG